MGDKKMERSIKGIALILLLSAFLISTPSSKNKIEEISEDITCNDENGLQQDGDLYTVIESGEKTGQ